MASRANNSAANYRATRTATQQPAARKPGYTPSKAGTPNYGSSSTKAAPMPKGRLAANVRTAQKLAAGMRKPPKGAKYL